MTTTTFVFFGSSKSPDCLLESFAGDVSARCWQPLSFQAVPIFKEARQAPVSLKEDKLGLPLAWSAWL